MSSGFPTCARAIPGAVSRWLTLGLLALAATACSTDLDSPASSAGGGAGGSTTSDAGATAATVCGLLRSFDNDAADIANETALVVRNSGDTTQRVDETLAGFDRLLDRVELHATAISTLDADVLVLGDALVADLARGADDARAELVDERAQFALLPEVTDGDLTGRVGQFFNALEKALSVIEPVIVDYADGATIAAFTAEPTCRFVVQR